jgi:hypothetical protein
VTLGEQLPEHFKKAFAQERLRAGAVVRRMVPDTRPPKIKRCVIVGISDDLVSVGVVFINSDINFNVLPTKELQELQYLVSATGRDYVEHDSFVDCSQLFEHSYAALLRETQNEPGIILGKVTPADLAAIYSLVKNAKTISPKLKKKYHLSL